MIREAKPLHLVAAVTSNSNHRDEGRKEVCDQDLQVTSSAEHLYIFCQVYLQPYTCVCFTVCIFTFVVAGQQELRSLLGWTRCMAGSEHGNYLSDCGDLDASFVVKGQRVNTRNIPYTLRSLDMSDEDMDTLIDGQSTGKSAKDQKRAKSMERSRKAPAELQFHTPGPPQKEKDPRTTADIGALDAM